jgi:dTDP-4-amino-4,6-dideoxygalactose transaminase
MSTSIQVPYHRSSIGEEEINEVVATLKSGWLTTGPRTAQFEQEFRDYVAAPHALAVNSCTAGLHLALHALKLGPGDEVITTPLTFCATVNVILHCGATPVLADVGPDGNIDPASILERITSRTKAIIPVHLAGLPCEMDEIWAIAKKHNLAVIEDSAHAAGAIYRGNPIGSGNPAKGFYSDASVYSFYATKNMTTGEGGMVTTHNEALAESLRILCLHGIAKTAWNRYSDKGNWYYEVLMPGFKYNLTDIQSSLGIHQLRKLDGFIQARARYAALYNELLADVEEFELPPDRKDCRHAWHLYTLRVNGEKIEGGREAFINALRIKGVGTSVHFIPIPLHPFFEPYRQRPENQVPRALELFPKLVSMPLYPSMTEEQVRFAAKAAKEVVRELRTKVAVQSAALHVETPRAQVKL